MKSLKSFRNTLNEASGEKSSGQHIVTATVSEPDHPAVSKRKETQFRKLKLTADNKEHALKKATEFYKKKGYKVHEVSHHSEVNEGLSFDVTVTHSHQGKNTDHNYKVHNVNDRNHAGWTAMKKHKAAHPEHGKDGHLVSTSNDRMKEIHESSKDVSAERAEKHAKGYRFVAHTLVNNSQQRHYFKTKQEHDAHTKKYVTLKHSSGPFNSAGFLTHGQSAVHEDVDHEAEMKKHHDAAHAALRKGDLESYHNHLDKKYEVGVARDKVNAKKPVKVYESAEQLAESTKAEKLSDTAHAATQEARHGSSPDRHKKAAAAHKDASEAHAKKLDSLIRNNGHPDAIAHHEAKIKSHDSQATVHAFHAHRIASKKKTTNEETVAEAAGDNLKITRHSKQAVEAGKRGDRAAQAYHLQKINNLRAKQDMTESVEDEDKAELQRLTLLVRFGLLDKSKLQIMQRSIKKLNSSQNVTSQAEREVLFELLQNLISVVTGDTSIFGKVRATVAKN